MKLQTLRKRRKKDSNLKYRRHQVISNKRDDVPDGIFRKCGHCKALVCAKTVRESNYICPKCGGYFRVHALRRIEMLEDEGSFQPWFEGMETGDPLQFDGYVERINNLRFKTRLDEAVICGAINIGGIKTAICVMDTRFLMASMGQVVGEKITRTVEHATAENMPVVIFACSGGARMQEGMVSLMQMAKTSAALKRHHDSGNLFVSVLTNPTTGGVTASFAMLGDIILAEPNALIGFAGPRVIEQTIGQKLPEGFQRSEYLLEHGFVDRIVERENMREELAQILQMHYGQQQCVKPTRVATESAKQKNKEDLSSWDRVLLSRKNDRPVAADYIEQLFDDFYEMKGDRYYGDDQAIIGGIAYLSGRAVTVIAQAKGHNTKENLGHNFGMPNPEGYRKALRLMKQAEKFNRPIICLVDTPGAFCGIEAEMRGQGEAIARNLFEMSDIATPIVSIVIGEGGSGGALALAVSNQVWMLENSVYSILSPEGYASILFKDGKLAPQAAGMMKMTAQDLYNMGIVERVFAEPGKYTRDNMNQVAARIHTALCDFINEYANKAPEEIAQERYNRFRNY